MIEMLDFTIADNSMYDDLSSPVSAVNLPDVVDWENAKEHIYNAREGQIFLGIDGEGEARYVDLDSDAPHVLINAGTGGGKSTLARGIATQAAMQGANVVFLDAKRHSHRWAKNLPGGIHYASTFSDIGTALISIGAELHRRNEVIEQWPGPIEEAPVGPRIVIIYEEMNATLAKLRKMTKGRGQTQNTGYSADDALEDIVFMGRAAKIHVIGIAQFASANAMGGSDIRENFGYRILARYTTQAWNMLAWDCGYAQPAPKHIGRGRICHAGTALETQFLYLTEEQAAWLVRAAYEYRKRNGLEREYTRKEIEQRGAHARAALERAGR
jgi:hypothetical protein